MTLRVLQLVLAVGNGLYGGLLLWTYSRAAFHTPLWPPSLDQQVLWLVAVSVLPAALIGLRWPLLAGILEFACAFLGSQLLHDAPRPDLRLVSSISMTIALVILALAVFHGILQVTREAFGEAEEQDEPQTVNAA
ncbi:MAG TPA: hypothetical protein VHX37_06580 [Acidobacteriaceae bacterium]|jgi:hypothetical protein|nr:hypothetical protein [Acidobacteriaceae bacterium]